MMKRPLRCLFGFHLNVLGESVICFNDCHCVNGDDAIAALEIAADIAEAEGV